VPAALRGPRRGEIAGLRWEDIDLFAGELTIREQVIVIDGVEYLGPPKSAAGVRVLALDEVSVRILWALWLEQLRRYGTVDPTSRVFRHQNGRAVRPDWLARRFARLVADTVARLHTHGAELLGEVAQYQEHLPALLPPRPRGHHRRLGRTDQLTGAERCVRVGAGPIRW